MIRQLLRTALVAALATGAAGSACAETIVSARYDTPAARYGHYALGRPHEYARLVARTDRARELALELPDDEVFEDLTPRLVRPAPDRAPELLVIISSRDTGSRLALVELKGSALAIGAQSSPIGMSHRWLNPVGMADLDGDGRAEIAAVITPHIGGTLKVYRRVGRELVEVAALPEFSNHVYGTSELALSAPAALAGGMRLLVPDASRRALRVIAFENGRLVETGRCALESAVVGPLTVRSPRAVSVGLATGTRVIAPADCRPPPR